MATTNIDRSLDDIIKEQRKLKKIKAQKLKVQQTKKKQTPQKQGKKKTGQTVANQNQRKNATIKKSGRSTQQGRRTQGRAAVSGKQKRTAPQGRKSTQNTRKKQNTGNSSRGRINGARVTSNRLKNKQGSLQKTKKIITKAKKIQNQQRINRQTRQTQQKDARQNIINKRRGMQSATKGNKGTNVQNMRKLPNRNSPATKHQRPNRKGITSSLLTVSINNPRVRLNRASPQWQQATNSIQTNRRNWRGGARSGGSNKTMDSGDLRISVPNDLFRLPRATLKPLKQSPYSRIDDGVSSVNKPKTYATLNERFSNFAVQSGRTITVE
ncbi:PREDICTED: ribosome-binding protein 1-like [Acropora digitifera]|uniref:ribosome-binding protein 1-like n=1 Tax=Acropora digitifera TaxID=70779 RepID=UPI00077AE7AF|nr:PREDICTED: ribosome-binding protein 1-like [Acropora digitifera]